MPRRLIVCCDGTWNTRTKLPTNVIKMARAILPEGQDGTTQVVFYDEGVGTSGGTIERLTGGAFGVGLSENVLDAYLFLLHNYVDGDAIYLFGFSRGAYTARSVVGLVRKCGLLHKRHADRLSEAYDLYRRRDDTPDMPEAEQFRAHYSRSPIPVKFVGVWDTVGALGVPIDLPFRFLSRRNYEFHDCKPSRSIEFAYQALAIDERRGPFRPTLWEQQPNATRQTLEQVWFPGVHRDVGGGSRSCGLSDIAFLWMKEKAQATGLAFDEEYLGNLLDPDELADKQESRTFPYTLLPASQRPIGEGYAGRESVHESALRRFEELDEYSPRNLTAYLDRTDESA